MSIEEIIIKHGGDMKAAWAEAQLLGIPYDAFRLAYYTIFPPAVDAAPGGGNIMYDDPVRASIELPPDFGQIPWSPDIEKPPHSWAQQLLNDPYTRIENGMVQVELPLVEGIEQIIGGFGGNITGKSDLMGIAQGWLPVGRLQEIESSGALPWFRAPATGSNDPMPPMSPIMYDDPVRTSLQYPPELLPALTDTGGGVTPPLGGDGYPGAGGQTITDSSAFVAPPPGGGTQDIPWAPDEPMIPRNVQTDNSNYTYTPTPDGGTQDIPWGPDEPMIPPSAQTDNPGITPPGGSVQPPTTGGSTDIDFSNIGDITSKSNSYNSSTSYSGLPQHLMNILTTTAQGLGNTDGIQQSLQNLLGLPGQMTNMGNQISGSWGGSWNKPLSF